MFLNFNYTHTLERLYGIASERILHIHGQIGDKWDKIELGHDGIVDEPIYSMSDVEDTNEVVGEE